MANISEVFGTISLNGKWTPEMIKKLNVVADHWRGYYYNIDVDGAFSEDERSQVFTACGRWAFANNLKDTAPWLLSDNKPEITNNFLALAENMHENSDAVIKFDYTEAEPGCCFLQTVETELKAMPFSLAPYVNHDSDCAYLSAGAFKIRLPGGVEGHGDKLIKPAVNESTPQLDLPEYNLTFTDFLRFDENKPVLTQKDGKQVIRSGFAEIVLAEPVNDFSELIGSDNAFIGKIEAIYVPAYTLESFELNHTDYDYTVENLLELDVEYDTESLFELYGSDFEHRDADSIEELKKFFGEYYQDYLDYIIENNPEITAEILEAKGF